MGQPQSGCLPVNDLAHVSFQPCWEGLSSDAAAFESSMPLYGTPAKSLVLQARLG